MESSSSCGLIVVLPLPCPRCAPFRALVMPPFRVLVVWSSHVIVIWSSHIVVACGRPFVFILGCLHCWAVGFVGNGRRVEVGVGMAVVVWVYDNER